MSVCGGLFYKRDPRCEVSVRRPDSVRIRREEFLAGRNDMGPRLLPEGRCFWERKEGMIGVKRRSDEIKAFLGKETEFGGKLIISGSVRIDGRFNGEIWGAGTLVVGKDASIEATIVVDRIQVSGSVKGTLEIKERTEITETGSFEGTIKSPRLVIGEGAFFDGQCCMAQSKADDSH